MWSCVLLPPECAVEMSTRERYRVLSPAQAVGADRRKTGCPKGQQWSEAEWQSPLYRLVEEHYDEFERLYPRPVSTSVRLLATGCPLEAPNPTQIPGHCRWLRSSTDCQCAFPPKEYLEHQCLHVRCSRQRSSLALPLTIPVPPWRCNPGESPKRSVETTRCARPQFAHSRTLTSIDFQPATPVPVPVPVPDFRPARARTGTPRPMGWLCSCGYVVGGCEC